MNWAQDWHVVLMWASALLLLGALLAVVHFVGNASSRNDDTDTSREGDKTRG